MTGFMPALTDRPSSDAARAVPAHALSGLRRGLILAALLAAYVAATEIGLRILSPIAPIAPIWPASGILAGGFAIVPPRDRGLLLAGVFIVTSIVYIADQYSLYESIAFGLARTLEGAIFLALYLNRRWPLELGNPRQVIHFLVAAGLACGVSSVVRAAAVVTSSGAFDLGNAALWFMAKLLGVITLAAPVLILKAGPGRWRMNLEAVLAVACGTLLAGVIFTIRGADLAQNMPVILIFAILFWSGVRCPPFANAILALTISLIVFYSIGQGIGPFSVLGWPATRSLFAAQNFVLIVSAGSLLLSILFAERRDRERLLADALELQKTLLHEVNHRVKNSLQLVTSILTIEAAQLRDAPARAALKTAQSRIDIIAGLHRRLYSDGRHAVVDLGEFIEDTAASILRASGKQRGTLLATVEKGILVDISLAGPIALAVAEIVTNSLKHGYPGAEGPIHLELAEESEALTISISDDGPGLPDQVAEGAAGGIGMRLITDLFKQVDAAVATTSDSTGLRYEIRVPKPASDMRGAG
jgi:two-component sensor histidine kinase/integral membrane sensor domain MASE1